MSKLKACLFRLAISDAMGVPVEFMLRGSFVPVTQCRSGGEFRLQVGGIDR